MQKPETLIEYEIVIGISNTKGSDNAKRRLGKIIRNREKKRCQLVEVSFPAKYKVKMDEN